MINVYQRELALSSFDCQLHDQVSAYRIVCSLGDGRWLPSVSRRMVERSVTQKFDRLADNLALAHHHGMGHSNHDMIGHAGEARSLDRDLSIVRAGDHQAVDPIDGAIPGDYPHAVIRRAQPARK